MNNRTTGRDRKTPAWIGLPPFGLLAPKPAILRDNARASGNSADAWSTHDSIVRDAMHCSALKVAYTRNENTQLESGPASPYWGAQGEHETFDIIPH
jgi:hypothetical protein